MCVDYFEVFYLDIHDVTLLRRYIINVMVCLINRLIALSHTFFMIDAISIKIVKQINVAYFIFSRRI